MVHLNNLLPLAPTAVMRLYCGEAARHCMPRSLCQCLTDLLGSYLGEDSIHTFHGFFAQHARQLALISAVKTPPQNVQNSSIDFSNLQGKAVCYEDMSAGAE
ncbi:MAG: hypothetical protein DDT36_00970 [Firmicutes bacterium]|nr:hypothetical protein [Bacillota bacterium]